MTTLSQEQMEQFAAHHGLKLKIRCDHCSTLVYHEIVKVEKTKDKATISYAPCPGHERGAHSTKFLSGAEKAHWQELFWGIRGAMEGYDPNHQPPAVEKLEESKILHFGDEDSGPFAVLYRGTCSFVSLLAEANKDWEENPFVEEFCHYRFAAETPDGTWRMNVSPDSPGAEMVTIAYWDDDSKRQGYTAEGKGKPKAKRSLTLA